VIGADGLPRQIPAAELAAGMKLAVAAGERVMTITANDETSLQAALTELGAAVDYSSTPVEPLPLFHGVIDGRAL